MQQRHKASSTQQLQTDKCSRAVVPGQSTHFPRKSHTMPPICWGAADTEGGGSEGALPPGRGEGRAAGGGGLGHSEGGMNYKVMDGGKMNEDGRQTDRQTDR